MTSRTNLPCYFLRSDIGKVFFSATELDTIIALFAHHNIRWEISGWGSRPEWDITFEHIRNDKVRDEILFILNLQLGRLIIDYDD